MIIMAINVKLPQWLDTIIYDKYEAIFEPCPLDVVYNPDQEFEFVKVYLGTYFPRSFAEAVAITCKLVQNSNYKEQILKLEEINILDYCCGTGGEIIGMIVALQSILPNLKRINIDAIDANANAIQILYHLIEDLRSEKNIRLEIHLNPLCLFVENDQDLTDLVNMLNLRYHFILSFKAFNEFVQTGIFPNEHVYAKITNHFLPLLAPNGVFILSDVTSKSDNSRKFYPELMNEGINDLVREYIRFHPCIPVMYKSIIPIACFYNEERCEGCYMQDIFTVTHSHKKMDKTKIAYRVICNADFAFSIMTDIKQYNCRAVSWFADKFAPYR